MYKTELYVWFLFFWSCWIHNPIKHILTLAQCSIPSQVWVLCVCLVGSSWCQIILDANFHGFCIALKLILDCLCFINQLTSGRMLSGVSLVSHSSDSSEAPGRGSKRLTRVPWLCIKFVVLGFLQIHPMPKEVRRLKNTGLKSNQAVLRFPVSSSLQTPVTSCPAGNWKTWSATYLLPRLLEGSLATCHS